MKIKNIIIMICAILIIGTLASGIIFAVKSNIQDRDSVLSMYNKDGYLMDVLKNTNRYAAKDENLDTYDFSTVVFGLPAKSTEAMRENYIYMNAGRVDYYLSQYDTAFPIQLITPIDENTVYVTYRLDRDGTEIYAYIVFEKEVKYLEAGDGIDETGNYEYWENRGEYYFENREIPSDCYTGLAIGDVLSEERMNELAFFTDINRCYYSKADGDGINPSDDSNITEEVCVSRDVILKFEMQYQASQNTYTIMSIEPYSCLGR